MSHGRPTPFLILADLRTGSTLLSSSLDRHPDIRCRGELFHVDDFPDNQLPGVRRHDLDAEELVGRALSGSGGRAAGFRAMVSHPEPAAPPRWAQAWEVLRAREGLRVICLRRADLLAQYASLRIALRTGWFTPSPGHALMRVENRPRIRVEPDALRRWVAERRTLYARRLRQLRGKPRLELTYEDLTDRWEREIRRVQGFLGVAPLPLEPMKQKQERRPLREVIVNYDELRQCWAGSVSADDPRRGVGGPPA